MKIAEEVRRLNAMGAFSEVDWGNVVKSGMSIVDGVVKIVGNATGSGVSPGAGTYTPPSGYQPGANYAPPAPKPGGADSSMTMPLLIGAGVLGVGAILFMSMPKRARR